jgi:deoxyadenosine/deoxycytidine kinase
MGVLIYVEGIIGVGKSTYCAEIAKRLNYRVIEEPVKSNPYLDLFYQDPKAFAFDMQVYLLHRRIGLQQLAAAEALYSPDFAGAMLDRSLFGDRVFEELHHEDGNISDLQHHAYLTSIRNMQLMIYPPTTLVFLDAEPQISMERIQKRSRGCEVGIKMGYLERLTQRYHRLIQDAKDGRYPWSHAVQVLHKSWNHDTMSAAQWDAEAASLKRFQEEVDAAASPEWKQSTIPVGISSQVPYRPVAPGNGSGNGRGRFERNKEQGSGEVLESRT